MVSLMPYIGGKNRLAKEISKRLHSTGADTLVDVFGGSGAVLLNAGFKKRIYNDCSGDLVTLFRVLAHQTQRIALFRQLRWMPPSRRIFSDDYRVFLRGGFSFREMSDPVERARATFYRQLFVWGGKTRSGGFSVSTGDRHGVKEVVRYNGILRRLSGIGQFFRETIIENMDFREAIKAYGGRDNVVLFADPPYVGTENYYAHAFSTMDHVFLAHLLSTSRSQVVATYYDSQMVRDLYPGALWHWESVVVTKNCQLKFGNKVKTEEVILTRRR